MGAAAAIVLGDGEWAWRDSLRRLAHGEEIPAYRTKTWVDAHSIRAELADSLLTSELTPSVEDRDTRRDLALHTLVVAAGEELISQGGQEMGALMQELCLDVDWLEEMVYFCPLELADKALPILAHLYRVERRKLTDAPPNRRLAAALAFEFARAGMSKEQARTTFQLYAAGGQKHLLNNRFEELALWEMRVIAARFADEVWCAEESLTWFQSNSRLPARGYVTLGQTLGSHERSLFGEPVGTPAFRALYRDAAQGGYASVCEASECSTAHDRAAYAATAACANGVPALVAAHDKGACWLVDVMGKWEFSAPVAEGMTCSWSFCGSNHPDFVVLASLLGADKEKALASARLATMGQFLYGVGNTPLAHSFFREAVKVQPLNYAAWAGYLSAGAPEGEREKAVKHFDALPGVAAALRSPEAK